MNDGPPTEDDHPEQGGVSASTALEIVDADGLAGLIHAQANRQAQRSGLVAVQPWQDQGRPAECGFALKEIWPENRWAPCPELLALIGREHPAVEAATAFVLNDDSGRELDFFHVVRFDEYGCGMPAWNSDFVFPPEAFADLGIVGRARVRCLSAETQMRTHTGYVLQQSEMNDLRLLRDRFGIDYPDEVADLLSAL